MSNVNFDLICNKMNLWEKGYIKILLKGIIGSKRARKHKKQQNTQIVWVISRKYMKMVWWSIYVIRIKSPLSIMVATAVFSIEINIALHTKLYSNTLFSGGWVFYYKRTDIFEPRTLKCTCSFIFYIFNGWVLFGTS